MTVTAPANIGTGTVTWRVARDVEDGPDVDSDPDYVAPTGTITFKPSVTVLRDVTAGPPITVVRDKLVAILDDDGYLCTKDADGEPGARGIKLIATDDPDLNPIGWTYIVSYLLQGADGRNLVVKSHEIYVLTDQTVDLTSVGPVEGSTPTGTLPAESAAAVAVAAALAAEASADAAETSADDAADDAADALAAVGAKANSADVYTKTASDGKYVPKWAASTVYVTGQAVLNPTGDIVTAATGFTSGVSYVSANWNLSPTYVAKGSNVINVKDFGAIGNGIADDTTAIQAALTLAQTLGGAQVLIPFGTYKTTAQLRIYANTHLHLEGATIVRTGTSGMLMNGISGGSAGGYTGQSNITVSGGTWDNNGVTNTNTANCLSFGHAQNIVVRDTTILNVRKYHAIEFNACSDALAQRVKFQGYITQDAEIGEAVQIDIATASGSLILPNDGTPSKRVRVLDCYFGPSGTVGTTSWKRGVGSHNSVVGAPYEHITIVGNIFEGITNLPIRGLNWNDVLISGNKFYDCQNGVLLTAIDPTDTSQAVDATGTVLSTSNAVSAAIISNNVFRNTDIHAIRVSSRDVGGLYSDVAVEGNVIIGTTNNGHGIYLDGIKRAVVGGNSVTGTTGRGINIIAGGTLVIGSVQSDIITVDGNNVSASGQSGILIIANHLVVTSNVVESPTSYGISCSASNYGRIANNILTNAGTTALDIATSTYLTIGQNVIAGAGGTVTVDSGSLPTLTVDSPPKVDLYTAGTSTWTKPPGAKYVEVYAIGGGGGGGSARRGAAGSARWGGGGGGGGYVLNRNIDAAILAATESVTVGAGGAGGAAVTTDDTDGNDGVNGGYSQFGNVARGGLFARFGGLGGKGTATAGVGSTGGSTAGGASSATVTAASGGTISATTAPGAGGGGGGITTGNALLGAGLGGATSSLNASATGVSVGGTPVAAAAGVVQGGQGGPGSSPSITATVLAAVAGAQYGAGGGGGGASLNGFASGAGGAGAAGIVLVITHF